MNEADTCRTYVIPKLKSAGWEDESIIEQLVLTPGQSQRDATQSALMPSILDKAFKGEL
jgi:hypothetical protein